MKRNVFSAVHVKISQNLGNKNKTFEKIPLKKLFFISVVINLLSITGIYFLSNNLPPEVPLFYGLPQGEEQLSTKSGLASTGIFALIVVMVNALVAVLIKNDFLKKSLIVAGFAVSFLSLFTTYQIVFLVGNL